jgi:hypothetical protein
MPHWIEQKWPGQVFEIEWEKRQAPAGMVFLDWPNFPAPSFLSRQFCDLSFDFGIEQGASRP